MAGSVIRIHYTFFLLLFWIGLAAWIETGPVSALNTVTFLALLFCCVLLHEFGHIRMARQFGVQTPEVLLLPIGGIARMDRIPEQPRAEFLIAIAGPAVTLVIALVLILLMGGLPGPETLHQKMSFEGILEQLAYANLILFFFNLLPAFPMDGGRVLRAGLSTLLGHLRGTLIAARVGQATSALLGLAGIFTGNILLVFVAIFIYLAAGTETLIAQLQGIMSGRPASEAMISHFVALRSSDPLSEAATALVETEQKDFPVLDDAGRLKGLLTSHGIRQALVQGGSESSIERFMRTDLAVASPWTRMDDIVLLLQGGAPAVGVVDEQDHCLGFITWENLMEQLMISHALEQR